LPHISPKEPETVYTVVYLRVSDWSKALGTDRFEPSVDISKLPSNYHNEEKQQRKVGNATVYSHREISKVSELLGEKCDVLNLSETKPVVSQEERSFETDRQSSGFRVFNFGLPQPRPRLTFLIFRLPELLKREKMPEPNWVKEEPVSDRRHRLLAIRNGLLTAPHPVKKKALLVTSNRTFVPRKRHFFFLWRKKI
uniref:Uncharacterized protein n=1 Tax=Varanus komodoensis TaxID=61221 RepID=A0A8D2LL96_VARKO